MYPRYMCILLYEKLIWWNVIPYIYCQLVWERGRCILSIFAFCYMWHWFAVTGFHTSIVNWGVEEGYMDSQYMCIVPYVKLLWCNVIPYIYSQLVWGRGACCLSICPSCYMWNLYGVMVFNIPVVNWNTGGTCILSICAFCYMWNLFGVIVFHTCLVT